MRMLTHHKVPWLYTLILYICGFFLFLEWLYPLKEVTDTSELFIFILYTVFCFFISALNRKWWLTIPLKGIAMLFILNSLFIPYTFLSGQWFNYLFTDISYNLHEMVNQSFYELTPMFRSLLFLILIWLISYLLYYWFVIMKRVFLFVLLTIIYITILDTFTVYDADGAIIRTFIFSFIALGIANFSKEMNNESIRFSWMRKTSVWAFPLIAVIVFSTIIGYAAPKFAPQWPDPVPFLKSAAEGAGGSGFGSGIRKVGYGEDDSQLGGSFVQDNTPVFQAKAKEKHYWRIETKDVYTGKGWERSTDPDYELQQNNVIGLKTFSDKVDTDKRETVVEFQGAGTLLEKFVYPYGIQQIKLGDVETLLDQTTGEIRAVLDGNEVKPGKYTITYNFPSFDIEELRKVKPDDPPAINRQYTQVPSTLPVRVGQLAREITTPKDSRYDKARAIEQYFGQNGFRYETQGVPVPDENQDYVDQFLFESKVGYCDNYSTAMVVMLRTLDIPARWVKGFTSGQKIEDNIGGGDNSYDLYEVTNANAHSWVEVYFPGSGWVPFEPTQGFSNLADFHYNLEFDEHDDTLDATENPDSKKPEQEMKQETPESQAAMASATPNEADSNINWWYVAAGIAVLLLLAFIGYRCRFRIKTFVLARRFNKESGAKTYQDAYHHLLKLLKHNGLAMESDQTLREFAKRIDELYRTEDMGRLTEFYERMLYKNEINRDEASELSELWKDLIKRITA